MLAAKKRKQLRLKASQLTRETEMRRKKQRDEAQAEARRLEMQAKARETEKKKKRTAPGPPTVDSNLGLLGGAGSVAGGPHEGSAGAGGPSILSAVSEAFDPHAGGAKPLTLAERAERELEAFLAQHQWVDDADGGGTVASAVAFGDAPDTHPTRSPLLPLHSAGNFSESKATAPSPSKAKGVHPTHSPGDPRAAPRREGRPFPPRRAGSSSPGSPGSPGFEIDESPDGGEGGAPLVDALPPPLLPQESGRASGKFSSSPSKAESKWANRSTAGGLGLRRRGGNWALQTSPSPQNRQSAPGVAVSPAAQAPQAPQASLRPRAGEASAVEAFASQGGGGPCLAAVRAKPGDGGGAGEREARPLLRPEQHQRKGSFSGARCARVRSRLDAPPPPPGPSRGPSRGRRGAGGGAALGAAAWGSPRLPRRRAGGDGDVRLGSSRWRP